MQPSRSIDFLFQPAIKLFWLSSTHSLHTATCRFVQFQSSSFLLDFFFFFAYEDEKIYMHKPNWNVPTKCEEDRTMEFIMQTRWKPNFDIVFQFQIIRKSSLFPCDDSFNKQLPVWNSKLWLQTYRWTFACAPNYCKQYFSWLQLDNSIWNGYLWSFKMNSFIWLTIQ